MRTIAKLLYNSRFYILATSVLVSLLAFGYFRILYESDQLYYIRLQQLFGLLSALLVYCAVIITPVSKLAGKRPIMMRVLFARRALGVSAAYFAGLHIYIALSDQIGGIGNVSLLPGRFKLSLLLGALAATALAALAITSFDKVIEVMTFPRWKQLHRLIYPATALIVVHVWLIGTHVENASIRAITYLLFGILLCLESTRMSIWLERRYKLSSQQRYIALSGLLLITIMSLICLAKLADMNHLSHSDAKGTMMMHDGTEH